MVNTSSLVEYTENLFWVTLQNTQVELIHLGQDIGDVVIRSAISVMGIFQYFKGIPLVIMYSKI